jgi:hypothetical protein
MHILCEPKNFTDIEAEIVSYKVLPLGNNVHGTDSICFLICYCCNCVCSSNEDIIQLIRDGEHDDIGAEKLRGLLKILPEVDELEMLRSFDGDKAKLGNAEKFLLQLIEVPK